MMWQRFWRRWTVDKPAAFGDWLWDVFVVQLAAWLDRLTLRQVIAFIPVLILILAYLHRIPIPPELMLIGDMLVYIDIFSMVFLLSVLSRVTAILFVIKRVVTGTLQRAHILLACLQRRGIRHRREGSTGTRKGAARESRHEDDECGFFEGAAWA